MGASISSLPDANTPGKMEKLSVEEIATADALISSSFCATKDTFAPVSSPLEPLTFDRVADGFPITSRCPIFRLPIELHSEILRYLDHVDFANLALVDRDCWQLARSAQFAIAYLSISHSSLQLIIQVFNESVDRDGGVGKHGRRIGPCVRRLVVGSNAKHALAIRDDMYPSKTDFEEECVRKVLETYDVLTSFLSHCLPKAFPNLELFQFADNIPIPSDLFRQLSETRLRHISFDGFAIQASDFSAEDQEGTMFLSPAWSSLQSLHVSLLPKLLWNFDLDDADAAERTLLAMLKAVSSSVENLRLGRMCYLGQGFSDSLPEFPRLRRLHLDECWTRPDDGSKILRQLLPLDGTAINSLEALQLDRIDSVHLLRIGRMPSLRRIVINDYSLKDRAINFAFLAANPQLELLSFSFPIKSRTVRDELLPILHSSGFSSLKVLRLTFASTRISRRALAAIGLIPTLEMLWLSAGQQFGWQYDWFVDHSVLQRGLAGLKRLRELAFTRDSYHSGGFRRSEHDEVRLGYYSFPVLPAGVSERDILTREDEEYLRQFEPLSQSKMVFERSVYVWEKWHRKKMQKLAREYADLFPQLEFMYAGEYPMEVVHDKRTNTRKISLLSDHREPYLTELNLKWGSQTI